MTGASDHTDFGRRLDLAFDSALEFIRLRFKEDGCVIGIADVLEHLDDRSGRAAGLTTDVDIVLGLCVALWADPNIHQVADGWIEFFWDGSGRRLQGASKDLRSRLLGQSNPEEVR